MCASERAELTGEEAVGPRGTAELIAGLDRELAMVVNDAAPEDRSQYENQLLALAIRSQLAAALAAEHVAVEIMLLRSGGRAPIDGALPDEPDESLRT